MTCGHIYCPAGEPCQRRTPRERVAEAVTWFERTGHCHGCGQPGAYCLCTIRRPCGCRHLHAMGSGVDADPVEVFAVDVAVSVDDQQEELF